MYMYICTVMSCKLYSLSLITVHCSLTDELYSNLLTDSVILKDQSN